MIGKTFHEIAFLLENQDFVTQPWGKNQQGLTRGEILRGWIKPQTRVLDIGCGQGGIGKELVNKGCWVMGVEKKKEAVERIREVYQKIQIGDIEGESTRKKIEGTFHYILCADVLEHLQNPAKLLRRLKKNLKEKGQLIISIPNIAHWSIRRDLLQGKFQYTHRGILDQTHRHFFTDETFTRLLKENDYQIIETDFIYAQSPLDNQVHPEEKWSLIKEHREFFALQYLYGARIKP